MQIEIPAWIKDHPAPAFGTWGPDGRDVPGVLQLDRAGNLTVLTGLEPGVLTWPAQFDAELWLYIPPRVPGRKLWDLLSGPGQELLKQIHQGHSVDVDNHELKGELTAEAATARKQLQAELDALGDGDLVEVVARHELPEFLFDPEGLAARWPGHEPLEAAVARLIEELLSQDAFFHGLNARELRRVLIAEVKLMQEDGRASELGAQHLAAIAREAAV